MPFKKGIAPVRRTLDYLNAGMLKLKPHVKVFATNYNVDQKSSVGAYEFIFWHYPQLGYHNRSVQILKLRNMTPTPCIQIIFRDGEKFVIDVFNRSRQEIHDHLLATFCLEHYQGIREKYRDFNPANFGQHCRHWCICEYPGQVPCPGYTALPKHMTGKYKKQMADKAKEGA